MEQNYDPIEEQYNRLQDERKKETQNKKKVDFNVKNYLNTKLKDGELRKTLTVRILNPNTKTEQKPETPFSVIHTHYLPSSGKTYVCAKKTNGIPSNIEKKCPFCDIREEASEQQKEAKEKKNQALWDKLKEIYKQNDTTINYVVRVIDRDDQEFGVKFWKMSQSTYETIIDIYKNNKVDDINIFDEHEGKDLIVTIKKQEGKNKVSSIMPANKQTPIAKTDDEINKLMSDTKGWSDVYGVKPYEYLELIIDGKIPFFDKTAMKWVEKKEVEKDEESQNEDVEDSNEEYSSSQEDGEGLPF